MDDEAREDFRCYVAARSPALLRTAYLLSGNRADAEDLLQTALAKTYLAWDRIRERPLPGIKRRDTAQVDGGVAVTPLEGDAATDAYRVLDPDGRELARGPALDVQNTG